MHNEFMYDINSIPWELVTEIIEKSINNFLKWFKNRNIVFNISWKDVPLNINANFKVNYLDFIKDSSSDKSTIDKMLIHFNKLSLKEKCYFILNVIMTLNNLERNITFHYLALVDLPFTFLIGYYFQKSRKKIKIIHYSFELNKVKKIKNKKSKIKIQTNLKIKNKGNIKKIFIVVSESYNINILDKKIKKIIGNSNLIQIRKINNGHDVESIKDLKKIWNQIDEKLNFLIDIKNDTLKDIELNFMIASKPNLAYFIGEKISEKINGFKNTKIKVYFHDFKKNEYSDFLEISYGNLVKIKRVYK